MVYTLDPTCVVSRHLAMVPAIDDVVRNLLSAFQILHATLSYSCCTVSGCNSLSMLGYNYFGLVEIYHMILKMIWRNTLWNISTFGPPSYQEYEPFELKLLSTEVCCDFLRCCLACWEDFHL